MRIAKGESVAPGPAPPGKVWSAEHGHWHDVVNPLARSRSPRNSTPTAPKSPDFAADTIDGNTIRLADYEGKVLLLDFWDSRSGPFIAEGSVAADELEGLRSEGLKIVGVNLDLSAKELRNFLEDNAWVTWPQVADREDYGEPNDNHVSLRYYGQLVGVKGRLAVNLNNN